MSCLALCPTNANGLKFVSSDDQERPIARQVARHGADLPACSQLGESEPAERHRGETWTIFDQRLPEASPSCPASDGTGRFAPVRSEDVQATPLARSGQLARHDARRQKLGGSAW